MNADKTQPSELELLSSFALAVATASDREAACRAAEHASSELIGHRLFTVMAFESERMKAERCNTSDPDNNPARGRKKKRDTEWGQHVLLDGKTYIGDNDEDIRRNFDDNEIIKGLGLCSVINIPIKRLGTTIGTMNLLDTTAHYNDTDARTGAIITMGLASVLL